jgi:triosephosphate isomerase
MSSRRTLIAGNWKLNLGPSAAGQHARALRQRLDHVEDVDVVVFPTALSVAATIGELDGTPIGVGVQWAHHEASGAYTGTNSATMAREAGCGWLLAGHSEARRDLGQDDGRVNQSVTQGLRAGLLPMMCLGESLEERQAGRLEAVLERQLRLGLAALTPDEVVTCTVAYEPIWAIGTGVSATPAQAQDAHAFIRGWLQRNFPAFVAEQTRILYGGSVKPTNAAELLAHPDIDGALIGGASLKADIFAQIVALAQSA